MPLISNLNDETPRGSFIQSDPPKSTNQNTDDTNCDRDRNFQNLSERDQRLWAWCEKIKYANILPPDLQSSRSVDTAADIFLTCSLGADLGLNRFQSIYGLYRMPNGQLTISTQCKRIIVLNSGGRFIREGYDETTGVATCVIEKDGCEIVGTFSLEDARAFGKMVYNPQTKMWEGVTTKSGGDSVWRRDWKHMLEVRACSRACDKVLAGTAGILQSTDEALDDLDAEKQKESAAHARKNDYRDLNGGTESSGISITRPNLDKSVY